MDTISVNRRGIKSTEISNAFIDRYMVTAGSSHLKTYLLFMRLWSDPSKEITVCGMADFLDCSESDILRSLRYWEKCGLLRLSYSDQEKKVLTGVEVLEFDEEKAEEKTAAASVPAPLEDLKPAEKSAAEPNGKAEKLEAKESKAASLEDPSENPLYKDRSVDFAKVSENDQFERLTFIVEQYIGKPLTRMECETFAWIFDKLRLEADLIIYLVEYCVSNDHRSVRYMEKVAIDWHSKHITTVDQAKVYTPLYNKNLYSVMNALGMGDRQPGLAERKIIDSWFQEMGFSLDLIVEACNRTMISIHEPNLKYVESILTRWKNAGISCMDQVKSLDDERAKKNASLNGKSENGQSRPAGAERKTTNNQKKPGGRFHGFDQRSTDYDALLRNINSKKTEQE